jgi:UDP-N-acetylmuramate dehydrogenase
VTSSMSAVERSAAPVLVQSERQVELLVNELRARLRGQIRPQEPMRRHTTFHIGGPADVLIGPADLQDLVAVLHLAKRLGLPVKTIGNGSNLLVGDRGIRGLVVRLAPRFAEAEWKESSVEVGAGARLARLLKESAEVGLSGLESLVGIPGTVGGALAMNAGTDVGAIGDLVVGATVVDEFGTVRRLNAADLTYRYRHSALRGNGTIVVSAELRLTPAPPEEIHAKIERLYAKRAGRQPLSAWSAGSAFKNPRGVAAGKVLERAGAKGMRVGDAVVSHKHANFMINRGRATAAQMRDLIARAHDLALRRYAIDLEPEIEAVGE